MAERKKASTTRPIADVAHPGETAPATNSKSVIVSHRPMIVDPMVVEAETPAKTPSVKRPKPTVTPSADVEHETVEATVSASSYATRGQASRSNESPDEQASNTPKQGDMGVVSPIEDEEATVKRHAEHDAAIDALVDSKQYFLPIKTIEDRRTQRFIILGLLLSIVLGVAWLDIALDAGLVQVANLKPVTHFFSN